MRKWLWMGTAAVVLGSVGTYWCYLASPSDDPGTPGLDRRTTPQRQTAASKHDGNAESSDTIEPLVVEGSSAVIRMPEASEEPAMTRVVLTAGMCQPPRPDAESGKLVRMPYADEDQDWFGVSIHPLLRVIESRLPRVTLFDKPGEPNAAEESEPPGAADPMPEPTPAPMMDYHQQYPHCPYHGHYPSYRR